MRRPVVMEFRKLMFPIALAIVWVVMAAMAMADFAGFDAATRDQRPAVAAVKTLRSALPQGRHAGLAIHD